MDIWMWRKSGWRSHKISIHRLFRKARKDPQKGTITELKSAEKTMGKLSFPILLSPTQLYTHTTTISFLVSVTLLHCLATWTTISYTIHSTSLSLSFAHRTISKCYNCFHYLLISLRVHWDSHLHPEFEKKFKSELARERESGKGRGTVFSVKKLCIHTRRLYNLRLANPKSQKFLPVKHSNISQCPTLSTSSCSSRRFVFALIQYPSHK